MTILLLPDANLREALPRGRRRGGRSERGGSLLSADERKLSRSSTSSRLPRKAAPEESAHGAPVPDVPRRLSVDRTRWARSSRRGASGSASLRRTKNLSASFPFGRSSRFSGGGGGGGQRTDGRLVFGGSGTGGATSTTSLVRTRAAARASVHLDPDAVLVDHEVGRRRQRDAADP